MKTMRTRIFPQMAGALLLAGAFAVTGCNDDRVAQTEVTIGLTLNGDNDKNIVVTEGTYTFTNISTGQETAVGYDEMARRAAGLTRAFSAGEQLATLTDGLYNVTFIGAATYTYIETTTTEGADGEPVTNEVTKEERYNVQGMQQNVQVTGGKVKLNISVNIQPKETKGDFVIAEIFAAGTLNSQTGSQYTGDTYVRIYNNSSDTLYADGLVFMESTFAASSKQTIDPNVMPDAFPVWAVVKVPGTGKEHPVAPGKYFFLCDNAINHREGQEAGKGGNLNSGDYSHADFEWYTESSNNTKDIDNPDVPNLEILFCYSASIWQLFKQGTHAFAIGRLPQGMTGEQYIADYAHTYSVLGTDGSWNKPLTRYKFPNAWVLDAVNMCPKNKWQWNVTDPSLDMGFTYHGENTTIAENAGRSVIRRTAYVTADGRTVLQDTNNSSVDFLPMAKSTMIP
jgi:hypothetical protein